MLSVEEQIRTGRLVCPVSHAPLERKDDRLTTADAGHTYPLVADVPILLADEEKQRAELRQDDGAMVQQYQGKTTVPKQNLINRWLDRCGNYQSAASRAAMIEAIEDQPKDALCVSIGGGPRRLSANLVNVNIGRFANVDVVGDAHQLPYADNSVDAFHCDAVLEHLEHPNRAVTEIFRILRPGGQLYASTPFLQHYHGYPSHFQNFTLTGHSRLFERAGFEVINAGTCVGPTFALTAMLISYTRFVPTRIGRGLASNLAKLFAATVRRADKVLNRWPNSHILAAATFVHARKPE